MDKINFETLNIVIFPGLNAKSCSNAFLRLECTVALAVFFFAILIGANPQCQKTKVSVLGSQSTTSTKSEGLLFILFKIS